MTVEERLLALEQAVISLSANKENRTDLDVINTENNARYLNLLNAVLELQQRVTAIEEWVINQ
jgi:hypothetical protein